MQPDRSQALDLEATTSSAANCTSRQSSGQVQYAAVLLRSALSARSRPQEQGGSAETVPRCFRKCAEEIQPPFQPDRTFARRTFPHVRQVWRAFEGGRCPRTQPTGTSMASRRWRSSLALALTLGLSAPVAVVGLRATPATRPRCPTARPCAPVGMIATPLKPSPSEGLRLRAQVYYDSLIHSSEHAYVLMAAAQSCALGAAADAASQKMLWHHVDVSHVGAMALLAACLSGGLNAVWLRQLEKRCPGQDTRAVLTKTVADYCIAGVIANSLYLIFVPLLTAAFAGDSTGALLDGWTPEGFRAVMMLEACTFTPYNLCAFKLVPPHMRPLAAAAVSATCTIVLSAITLM